MSGAVKVFKFGGASVRDAAAVRNLASIVQHYSNDNLVVVISAMGKTTNALELVADACFRRDDALSQHLDAVVAYHRVIVADLFGDEDDAVRAEVDLLFDELVKLTQQSCGQPFDMMYDQIVPFGELISTTIISCYLNQENIPNRWLDARQLVFTDDNWRNAHVIWDTTRAAINHAVTLSSGDTDRGCLFITQGFIGREPSGFMTTLGREGSDFTAAVLAWSLEATDVTIWKDVPGLLNADPKHFPDTVKLDQISYEEAIELSYYGATIIHPKTIKPLQNRKIPLYVRSFLNPSAPGSVIGDFMESRPDVPSFIFKSDQVLISIAPRDFSFIAENNLQIIFGVFSTEGVRINLMQNSAISFSVCVDGDARRIPRVISQLNASFKVRYNEGLQLITIRRYTQGVIDHVVAGRTILVEQRSRLTAQLVVM
ncbi:MAG TPA: aspartate kinase [Bacteroidales bacterium]|nr:MAG: aspartate kinase [Bacteroidetes bacterium GWE2_42_24]OFY29894.1 MAG: aspartate kinase [Bacteroidetes bacterium GWF2_43_11]HBZ67230.1 aspartate kinase [Bacteroidales bacterium]